MCLRLSIGKLTRWSVDLAKTSLLQSDLTVLCWSDLMHMICTYFTTMLDDQWSMIRYSQVPLAECTPPSVPCLLRIKIPPNVQADQTEPEVDSVWLLENVQKLRISDAQVGWTFGWHWARKSGKMGPGDTHVPVPCTELDHLGLCRWAPWCGVLRVLGFDVLINNLL